MGVGSAPSPTLRRLGRVVLACAALGLPLTAWCVAYWLLDRHIAGMSLLAVLGPPLVLVGLVGSIALWAACSRRGVQLRSVRTAFWLSIASVALFVASCLVFLIWALMYFRPPD